MRAWPFALLLLAACARTAPVAEPPRREAPGTDRGSLRAEAAAGRAWLDSPAVVLAAPGASAALGVPLPARVVRVRVRRGEHVKAGQALIDVIMPEAIRAAGALKSAAIRLEAYERRREGIAALFEQRLARASELVEADAEIASARAERESARAILRAAGLRDVEGDALLGGTGAFALRAPIDGVVTSISARLGEMREPGGGPVLELAGRGDVQIEARLAHLPPQGGRFGFLAAGRMAALALEAFSPRVDPMDGSWVGWFRVEPGAPAPAAGTTGIVRFEPPAGSVAIPLRLLEEHAAGSFVSRRSGSEPRRTPVRVLVRGNAEAIVSGLDEGAELVEARAERGP